MCVIDCVYENLLNIWHKKTTKSVMGAEICTLDACFGGDDKSERYVNMAPAQTTSRGSSIDTLSKKDFVEVSRTGLTLILNNL